MDHTTSATASLPATYGMATDLVLTNCAICDADLSDSASVERGVGPTCWSHVRRAMERAEHAPDYAAAYELAARLDAALWADGAYGDTVEVRQAVHELHLLGRTDDRVDRALTGCRRLCSWAASKRVSVGQHRLVCDLLVALGYPNLAGLLSGEAARGKTRVWAQGGRLHMAGPRCQAGNAEIKRISGRRFHPRTGDQPASWSVPVSGVHEMRRVVMRYWPNTDIDLARVDVWETVVEQLADDPRAAQLLEIARTDSANTDGALDVLSDLAKQSGVSLDAVVPDVVVRVRPMTDLHTTWSNPRMSASDALAVEVKWTPAFIDALKAELPKADRLWFREHRVWVVRRRHADALRSIIGRFWTDAEVEFRAA